MIALPHREHVDVLAAQHAAVSLSGGLHTVGRHWLCVLEFSRYNPLGFGRFVNDSTGSEAG